MDSIRIGWRQLALGSIKMPEIYLCLIRHLMNSLPSYARYILLLAIYLFAFSVQAETSVWLVEKDGAKLYLGGTLHLLEESDFPLPEEFDKAYAAADALVFETDIAAMQSPGAANSLMSAMMYSDGRTLQSVLSPATYDQLGQYVASMGMPIAFLERFTAGGASLTVTMLELQKLGVNSSGVDMHYFVKAQQDGKSLIFFETIEEQLAILKGLGEGVEDEMVLSTLNDMAKLPELFGSMKAHWRKGDVDALYKEMLAEMETEFPAAYDELLLDRNNKWLPEIHKMLENPSVEFVLVGVGHLAGQGGLLTQLQKQGYKITQL